MFYLSFIHIELSCTFLEHLITAANQIGRIHSLIMAHRNEYEKMRSTKGQAIERLSDQDALFSEACILLQDFIFWYDETMKNEVKIFSSV